MYIYSLLLISTIVFSVHFTPSFILLFSFVFVGPVLFVATGSEPHPHEKHRKLIQVDIYHTSL